jgi:hypothetical protein
VAGLEARAAIARRIPPLGVTGLVVTASSLGARQEVSERLKSTWVPGHVHQPGWESTASISCGKTTLMTCGLDDEWSI